MLDHDAMLTEPDVLQPPASRVTMPRQNASSLQRAARIAGAAYLVTDATAIFVQFFLPSRLIVSGDAARTASNIVAHAQLFRVGIVVDLLGCAGVVILNLALYELLAPVHRSLARLAAFWRLAEATVGGATALSSFVVLSLLSGATYLQAFQPNQLQALARLFIGARESGNVIALLFFVSPASLIRRRRLPLPNINRIC